MVTGLQSKENKCRGWPRGGHPGEVTFELRPADERAGAFKEACSEFTCQTGLGRDKAPEGWGRCGVSWEGEG